MISNVGGAVRRFDLPPMAASGLVGMLDQTEYISVIWVTAAIGSAFTAGHFWKRARNAGPAKSNQKGSCPTTRHLAQARCARNPPWIWGAAATRHPWRRAAKPASLPVYPPNPWRITASVV
ncbi:hypothetical protein [Pseudomonas synxantha]|nr:hypothetical protein [Pseudomonas synxantha]